MNWSCWLPSKKDKLNIYFFASIIFKCSWLHQEVWYKKPTVATSLSVREVRQEGSSGVCKETHTREARWVSSDDAKTKQHTCCALFLQLLPPEFKYIFPLVLIFGVWSLQSYQSCSDCRFIVPAFFQNWAWNKKSWSYLCMFLEFVIKSVVSGSSCTVGENHPHFTGGIFEHLLGLISIG